MNIQIFGTKKCNDTKKAGDGGIYTGGLEGLDVVIEKIYNRL